MEMYPPMYGRRVVYEVVRSGRDAELEVEVVALEPCGCPSDDVRNIGHREGCRVIEAVERTIGRTATSTDSL